MTKDFFAKLDPTGISQNQYHKKTLFTHRVVTEVQDWEDSRKSYSIEYEVQVIQVNIMGDMELRLMPIDIVVNDESNEFIFDETTIAYHEGKLMLHKMYAVFVGGRWEVFLYNEGR